MTLEEIFVSRRWFFTITQSMNNAKQAERVRSAMLEDVLVVSYSLKVEGIRRPLSFHAYVGKTIDVVLWVDPIVARRGKGGSILCPDFDAFLTLVEHILIRRRFAREVQETIRKGLEAAYIVATKPPVIATPVATLLPMTTSLDLV